ncbi:MAG: endopeptidase La, partial [Planctomycetota bacterium]|nr:endopeptidase La [Planctomycetota bacterium]
MNVEDTGQIADFIAWHMNLPLAERQSVLEEFNVVRRLELVTGFLAREMQIAEIGSMIQSRVQEQIGRSQKEHFLREQLKAIQKELGEEDPRAAEVAEIRRKLAESKMTEAARKEAEREVARLERISPFSPEYSVAQTYLDWMVNLPWEVYTKDDFDISRVRRVLDRDHFDLKKVKDRILEYVAVRKLNPAGRGPILCFVGPPGVGKTSLGRSIASALGRKFSRLSLGGVRDEAEIRGHRRTYVGALPGKIIQEIRRAGSANPLIMLDEVDKLGVDFRGDPASALLEVLDPEQNFSFTDHYLGVPFDLSKVMFIVTANVMDTVPPALRDRFETISLPGYTEEEKLQIARNYLIPRQVRENGLKPDQVEIEDAAILAIVRGYTREAGVRQLERNIASICRKIALRVTEGRKIPRPVGQDNLKPLLGPEKLYIQTAERTRDPGVAVGLAWTETGGDILFIESTRMKGRGGLLLTGHLGQVMQESARAALSYIRSHAESLGIKDLSLQDEDIHIHVPEGATPKDGPSAGLSILASLVSLFTGRPVRPDTAMTGEITLRGKILPVGGIKEKVLAARRAGITNVILPAKNRDDVAEMDRSLTRNMKFHLVNTIDEALPLMIRTGRRPARRRGAPEERGRKPERKRLPPKESAGAAERVAGGEVSASP